MTWLILIISMAAIGVKTYLKIGVVVTVLFVAWSVWQGKSLRAVGPYSILMGMVGWPILVFLLLLFLVLLVVAFLQDLEEVRRRRNK